MAFQFSKIIRDTMDAFLAKKAMADGLEAVEKDVADANSKSESAVSTANTANDRVDNIVEHGGSAESTEVIDSLHDNITGTTYGHLGERLDAHSASLAENTNDYSYTLGFLNGLNQIRTRRILKVNGFYSIDDSAIGTYRVVTVTGTEIWTDINDNDNNIIFQISDNCEIRAFNGTKKLKILPNHDKYNIKLYGAGGNSIQNDGLIIQLLLNKLPQFSTLFFDSGYYKTQNKLIWNGKVHIKGASRRTTKIFTDVELDVLLEKDETMMVSADINEIDFDGKGLVNNVFNYKGGKGSHIQKNTFQNSKLQTVLIGSVNQTWEIYFHNNNVYGLSGYENYTPSQRPDYALDISYKTTDSFISDNVITNSKIAVMAINGFHNTITQNHTYCYFNNYDIKDVNSLYGIEVNGSGNSIQINEVDSANDVGILINRWGNTINGNYIYWNPNFTNLTDKSGIKINNTNNNISSLIVANNSIASDGATNGKDIVVLGNMPNASCIKNNTGNMNTKFDNINYSNSTLVPNGVYSIKINFSNSYNDYNYFPFVATSWKSGDIAIQRNSDSFTVFFNNAPDNNQRVYWRVDTLQ